MRNRKRSAAIVCCRQVGIAFLLSGALAISGCGGETAPQGGKRESVSGMVTVKGDPLTEGQITFDPAVSGPTASTLVKEGRYSFSEENGPIAGKYRVKIVPALKRDRSKGGPAKDAPIVKTGMPTEGWKFDADIQAGQSAPLDYKID